MSDYKIIINEGVDENTKEIIEKYWCRENNNFKYPLKYFTETYQLNSYSLTKIIKDNSFCLKQVQCYTCAEFEDIKIDIKGNFNINSTFHTCQNCEAKRKKAKEEAELERKRLIEERELQLRNDWDKKKFNAVENKLWLNLNNQELSTLIEYIRYNDINLIDKYYNPNNVSFKHIKFIEKKLQDLGFFYIPSNRESIEFAPNIQENITLNTSFFSGNNSSFFSENTLEELCFLMAKKIDKQTETQPDFSGSFILPYDIVLRANQRYLYGGWIISNGSVNCKFTPIKNIKPRPIPVESVENPFLDVEPFESFDKNKLSKPPF